MELGRCLGPELTVCGDRPVGLCQHRTVLPWLGCAARGHLVGLQLEGATLGQCLDPGLASHPASTALQPGAFTIRSTSDGAATPGPCQHLHGRGVHLR